MWRFLPRTILSLTLTGFTLALLPLAVALVMASFYVNRLVEQSQVAVVQAVEATQNARLLISQITAMERSVRQYLVLRDADLLKVYRETHEAWQARLERLNSLRLGVDQRGMLVRLDATEQELFDALGAPEANPMVNAKAAAEFTQVRNLAREFLDQSMQWVDREVARLQSLAGEATLILGWMMLVVIPAVLILAGIFAALINKPLRLMAQAIRRLGNKDFTTPVALRGPRDLEALGAHLDWLRARLAELEEQKIRFLSHMSHEFKTPLASLREGAELLGDELLGPLNSEQRDVVAILQYNNLCLQRLIEDLLNFNQALSRNLELRPESLNLAKLVAEVVKFQRLAWTGRKLQVVTDLDPLNVTGDPEKLATLVDNLFSNAVKFSPVGGVIRIKLRTAQAMARLTVHDSGPGFHPADRDRVFEPFYQGRTVAEGHLKGSGLGLAIAQEYALAHGGKVEIIDCRTAGGCVRLSLPL